jgi:putative copper export protein
MRIRAAITALSTVFLTLALAVPAMAGKGGEGLYGKTDDKVVTNFGFGLIVFFALLVTVLTIAQAMLERRKRSK